MKPLLFAAVAMALAAAPALAQEQPQQPNVFDSAAHARAYNTAFDINRPTLQCFNGEKIKGVSRSGQRTLILQNGAGAIYEVTLRHDCHAADRAQKISALSSQGAPICRNDSAILFARTTEGVQRCRITDVRRLSSGEIAALGTPGR